LANSPRDGLFGERERGRRVASIRRKAKSSKILLVGTARCQWCDRKKEKKGKKKKKKPGENPFTTLAKPTNKKKKKKKKRREKEEEEQLVFSA